MNLKTESKIRVLVIDDDEDDFFMLRDQLREADAKLYSVDWASSYQDGLNQILDQKHDIAILDYRLGGETGLDLLKAVSATECKTPIILLTGYGEREVDLEAMRVGASDYLVKDQINPTLLEKSIRYSIHRAQS